MHGNDAERPTFDTLVEWHHGGFIHDSSQQPKRWKSTTGTARGGFHQSQPLRCRCASNAKRKRTAEGCRSYAAAARMLSSADAAADASIVTETASWVHVAGTIQVRDCWHAKCLQAPNKGMSTSQGEVGATCLRESSWLECFSASTNQPCCEGF